MFLVNSRNPRFSATPRRFRRTSYHNKGHTFSRSYGVNLPSSLTSVLSRALGYSPRPPESVCGTDNQEAPRAAFLGSMGSLSSRAEAQPHHLSALTPRLSLSGPMESAYWLEPGCPITRLSIPFSVPARFNAIPDRCRNINLLAITYAFRPRLRFRLTHGRIILPQETLGLRRQDFSSCLSLLMPA